MDFGSTIVTMSEWVGLLVVGAEASSTCRMDWCFRFLCLGRSLLLDVLDIFPLLSYGYEFSVFLFAGSKFVVVHDVNIFHF